MAKEYDIHVEKLAELRGHKQAIYSLAPAIHSGHLLSAGAEGIVAQWNIENEEGKAILQAPCPIYKILPLPERGILAMGLQNGELAFADLKSNKMIRRIKAHIGGVFDIMPFLDGKKLLASGEDGKLSVWDLDNLELERIIPLANKSLRTLDIHPDTGIIASGCSDNHIYLLDSALNPVHRWLAHGSSVFRVMWNLPNNCLFSTGRDAMIRSWSTEKPDQPLQSVAAHMYAVNDFVEWKEAGILVSGSMDKSIKLWRAHDLQLLKVINFEKNACHFNGVNRLLWHEGSLFSCGDDRIIMRWGLTAPYIPPHSHN